MLSIVSAGYSLYKWQNVIINFVEIVGSKNKFDKMDLL